jgi:hypothetical protein
MCVTAAIPVTTGATADTAVHASFTGQVLFHNVFHGKLAATDYPKINVSLFPPFDLPPLRIWLLVLYGAGGGVHRPRWSLGIHVL